MNKGDLVGKIAKEASITKSKAEAAFNSLIGGISASLKKGHKVTLVGFGTFSVAKRKARTGRNPRRSAQNRCERRLLAAGAAGQQVRSRNLY